MVERDEDENLAGREPIKIDPKFWTVSVFRSCEGGGTGQEFYTNLQKEGDSPGNKWYDPSSGSTWIQAEFKEPQLVRMIKLKSANDCPERDPYEIMVEVKYGKDLDFHKYKQHFDDIIFDNRYDFQDFYLEPEKYQTIRVHIIKNKSMKDYSHWGTGTQLAEFVLYQ